FNHSEPVVGQVVLRILTDGGFEQRATLLPVLLTHRLASLFEGFASRRGDGQAQGGDSPAGSGSLVRPLGSARRTRMRSTWEVSLRAISRSPSYGLILGPVIRIRWTPDNVRKITSPAS